MDRDLIARSGRVGAVTTGNNLSLDTHFDVSLIIMELEMVRGGEWRMGGRSKTRGNADSQFFIKVGGKAARAADCYGITVVICILASRRAARCFEVGICSLKIFLEISVEIG